MFLSAFGFFFSRLLLSCPFAISSSILHRQGGAVALAAGLPSERLGVIEHSGNQFLSPWVLTRVGAVLLRGHGHTDHPSTGRCHAKRGGASEQKCTLHTGCIERRPSEISPRWAPLSCWRGRPGARRVAVTGESILACRPGGAALQFRHCPLAPGSMLACGISDPHVEYYRWH